MRGPVPSGPLVVCSVLPGDVAQAKQELSRAPDSCGLVELRADRLRAEEIEELVHGAERPLIVTVRRRGDGGSFDGSEEERERLILAALESGARFVDIECGSSPMAALSYHPTFGPQVLLSRHRAACEGAGLIELYRWMRGISEGPLKIVTEAGSVAEITAVRDLLREAGQDGFPLAAFAMGAAGAASRLLAPSWGSWATYGALAVGSETAAGQYTAAEMLETYDVLGIGPRTEIFALVGDRVSNSPSPAMHAAGYRRCGLDARYLALETGSFEAFETLIDPKRGLGLSGFAVTIPFKDQAAARCAPRDEVSSACGAVNTVIVEGQTRNGYNTDGAGVLSRVRNHLDPRGMRAAIVGAGGTARSIAFELARAGSVVTIFSRTVENAREAGRRVGASAAPLAELQDFAWDILVNATPLGGDGRRFLDPDALRGRLVIDAVYSPRPTALIRDAKARGLQSIDGLEMLAAQGVLQFKHMTGVDVEYEVLHAAALQRISSREG